MVAPSLINKQSLPLVKDVLTWTAPALLVPALRYRQDDPDQRRELFLRDASTYTVGAALFLGTALLSKRLLGRLKVFKSQPAVELTAFLVALTANILYAGIGAVHFSRAFSKGGQRDLPLPGGAFPRATSSELLRPASFQALQRMQYHA